MIIRSNAVVVDRSVDDLVQGHLSASTLLKSIPMQSYWEEPEYAFTASHESPQRIRFYLVW